MPCVYHFVFCAVLLELLSSRCFMAFCVCWTPCEKQPSPTFLFPKIHAVHNAEPGMMFPRQAKTPYINSWFLLFLHGYSFLNSSLGAPLETILEMGMNLWPRDQCLNVGVY